MRAAHAARGLSMPSTSRCAARPQRRGPCGGGPGHMTLERHWRRVAWACGRTTRQVRGPLPGFGAREFGPNLPVSGHLALAAIEEVDPEGMRPDLEGLERRFLVRAHEARIPLDIGGEDCGEFALDTRWFQRRFPNATAELGNLWQFQRPDKLAAPWNCAGAPGNLYPAKVADADPARRPRPRGASEPSNTALRRARSLRRPRG